MKFRDGATGKFMLEDYKSAIRTFSTAMEILVDFSSYPTAEICKNSHDFRPLGLGYANLGTLLMVSGMPYARRCRPRQGDPRGRLSSVHRRGQSRGRRRRSNAVDGRSRRRPRDRAPDSTVTRSHLGGQ
jgi:hypothetical protein